MSSAVFNLHLAHGKVRAKLFTSGPDTIALTLVDDKGKPFGKSRAMRLREAESFITAFNMCPPHFKESLLWAKMGYGMKDQRDKAAGIRRVA